MGNVNVIKNNTMAQCRGCGKAFGCSCQLSNGLCINCLTQIKPKESTPAPVYNLQNDLKHYENNSVLIENAIKNT